jgi:hypothetical protein
VEGAQRKMALSELARRRWLAVALSMSAVFLLWSAPALAVGPIVEEKSESVFNVTSTSARLQARINPQGKETTYQFEYGTSEAYGTSLPVSAAPVGSGSAAVTVTAEPQGLSPSTTYRYRVVATVPARDEGVDGEEGTFTTQSAGGEFSLPDGRAWEMVSPPDKRGSTIYPLTETGVLQAAEDGGAITYLTDAPTEAEPKGAYSLQLQMLSRRGVEGWHSRDIVTPHDTATGFTPGIGFEYRFFSSDLSLALVEPQGANAFTPLSPQATERTPYLRFDFSCEATPATCYEPLVTTADVRAAAKFGGGPEELLGEAKFAGATSDLSHVLIDDSHTGLASTPGDEGGIYEWPPSAGGELQLVSILPESEGGKPASALTEDPQPGSVFSGRHEISDDGSRVFWSDHEGPERLYLRDVVKGETLRIGSAGASEFQIANSDGSRVFFIAKNASAETEGTLEVCNVTEVTGKLACEMRALAPEVQGSLPGAGEDGSYVYFVSKAALTASVEKEDEKYEETDNLYVDHYSGTMWEAPHFIAVLPEEDRDDWKVRLKELTARVSPNGRWLAFMSRKSLTGYDNRDAVSGEPDEEVYLYDAGDGRLVCASCDPTGARPVGREYGKFGDYGGNGLLGGGDRVWPENTWLAASVPGWTPYTGGAYVSGAESLYQSRYLSDSGRLFFNGGDALVPQDVNGTWDVYEYEPEGVGSCSPASVSGSIVYTPERETSNGEVEPAGCVALISSGHSAEQSAFMDASESGDDVFFLTASQLVPQDVDTYFDVYDAHVCFASVPCLSSPVAPPPCDTGDSCKAEPSPQPLIFGAPSSETLSGAGNTVSSALPTSGAKPKSSIRAQERARALSACRKRYKPRRGRAALEACERLARKRDGVKHSDGAKPARGGDQ